MLRYPFLRTVLRLPAFALLLATLVAAPGAVFWTAYSQEAPSLAAGIRLARELRAEDTHQYLLSLRAGQFIRIDVEQQGIDVSVELLRANQGVAPIHDHQPWDHGTESLLWETQETAVYQVRIQAGRSISRKGRYVIHWEERPSPTEWERGITRAERLHMQALVLQRQNNHIAGLPLAEQALALREALLPANHLAIAESLELLMYLLELREDYHDLERRLGIADRILRVREQAVGPNHPIFARWLHNMAMADPLVPGRQKFQRALEILEASYGPDHPDVGLLLSNYASRMQELGDYNAAEAMYLRAISIREKALGPNESNLAQSLSNLGNLYVERGQYDRGEQYLRRALAIWTQIYGVEHERTSHPIFNLAHLYRRKGDFARAEPLMRQAVEIRLKVLLPHDPLTGEAFHGLALVYLGMGEYGRAEEAWRRAETYYKHFGPSNDEPSPLLLPLRARIALARGRAAEARELLRKAVTHSETQLSTVLAFGSEQDKLDYLDVFAEETNQVLSLHARDAPHDPLALDLAFTIWLQRKGRALDEMNRSIGLLRRIAGSDAAPLFDRLMARQAERARLATTETDEPSAEKLRSLSREINELQSTISARSAEFRTESLPPVTLAEVQSALPADSALIEFAIYQPEEPRERKKEPARYLAYVLHRQGSPRWIELGPAKRIDEAVQAFRETVITKRGAADPRTAARDLDRLVMQPIRPLLGKARRIFLAPEGALNLIPFGALRDQRGRYLIEDFLFVYLTSGRDLPRLRIKHQGQSEEMILAVSDFDAAVTGTSLAPPLGFGEDRGARGSSLPPLSALKFDRLRFAISEGEAVQRLRPEARLYRDAQATETLLKQVRRPRLLHIVTHGFSLPSGTQRTENPLLRSGIALSGANQRRSGTDDGILTAYEAAALDLWGTKLVVLSACETGAGDVRQGEGVFGFRRALVLAGAETQLTTLWRIDDGVTNELMTGYYERLRAGQGRAEALRQAQLALLRNPAHRHPFFWASFVAAGEWAPLDRP